MVRTDPEPDDLVLVENSKSSIVNADSYRINWTPTANPLEFQAWVVGIRNEEAV